MSQIPTLGALQRKPHALFGRSQRLDGLIPLGDVGAGTERADDASVVIPQQRVAPFDQPLLARPGEDRGSRRSDRSPPSSVVELLSECRPVSGPEGTSRSSRARATRRSVHPRRSQPLRLTSVIRPSRSRASRMTSAVSRYRCARSRSWRSGRLRLFALEDLVFELSVRFARAKRSRMRPTCPSAMTRCSSSSVKVLPSLPTRQIHP